MEEHSGQREQQAKRQPQECAPVSEKNNETLWPGRVASEEAIGDKISKTESRANHRDPRGSLHFILSKLRSRRMALSRGVTGS